MLKKFSNLFLTTNTLKLIRPFSTHTVTPTKLQKVE